MNLYAKFRCAPLRIKKALGIFGPLENWFQEQEEQLECFLSPAFRRKEHEYTSFRTIRSCLRMLAAVASLLDDVSGPTCKSDAVRSSHWLAGENDSFATTHLVRHRCHWAVVGQAGGQLRGIPYITDAMTLAASTA